MRKQALVFVMLITLAIIASCSNDDNTNHELPIIYEASDEHESNEVDEIVYTEEQPSTGRIFLYGEIHASIPTMDRQLEIWGEYYHNHGMRHLFIEVAYFTAEFLNIWMQADDDTILYQLYEDWEGAFAHNPHTLVFYRTIKNDFPETIFHGTDVGHQSQSAGRRFLQYLRDNDLQDTESYRLTRENIAQFHRFVSEGSHAVRAYYKPQNFIREFDKLGNQDVMAIHGMGHVFLGNFGGYPGVPTLAATLYERYGDALQTFDMTHYALMREPDRIDIITINDVDYEASYFGTDTFAFNDIVSRSFWRLENAYDDFRDNLTTGTMLPFDDFPMLVELGQVFIMEAELTNGSTRRSFYRSDGGYWQGIPATSGFRELVIIDPIRIDIITINDVDYEASYFGTETLPFIDIVSRSFWRLENAYEYFYDSPLTGNGLPFNNFPIHVEVGQVFVVDTHFEDGTVIREFYRADGHYWNDLPSTQEFIP